MSMSQPEGPGRPVPEVTDTKPLLFEAPEPRQHSMGSSQDGLCKNDTVEHHVVPGESALRGSVTDSPQVLQDVASAESLGEADWMMFDKEAADSDKDAIEIMSIGDFRMRTNISEPARSLAQQYYEQQSRLFEAQNKKRLDMARQENPKPAINSPLQEYQLQLQRLEAQRKISSKMTRQEQPEPRINLAQQDYQLQLRILEKQNNKRLGIVLQEEPEPKISLAQQDYEMQLKLLEAQNKKRLQMARQEQSKLNTQLPRMQMAIKGPPEPNVMAVMGSRQGNAAMGSGNMMATLPPGAPYLIPASRYYPVNPVAMNVNNMADLGAQPTTLPMSPNPPDPPVLVLQRQLNALQLTNQVLRRQLKDAKGTNFAVFHCILGQEGEGIYLEKPYWTKSGEKFQLKADSPVLYPDAYILYKPVAFVVYKYYSTDIPAETREALQQTVNMPDPQPNDEVIQLVSEEMIRAMQVFKRKDEEAQKELLCLSVKNEMQAPYLWWYHYRDNRNIISGLPQPEAELIHLLINWIDTNYSELYDRIDGQFKRGVVSAASLAFLIQPGDVLVHRDAEGVEACLAMSWLHKEKRDSEMLEPLEDPDWTLLSVPWAKKSEWSWEVVVWSYVYNGDLYRLRSRLVINLDVDTADTEIPIVNLDAFPLRFASQELRETLQRRGKIFWSCRHGNYISYDNQNKNEKHAQGQHYMIDCRTYKNLHIKSMLRQDITRKESSLLRDFMIESAFILQDQAPSEPDVYLFPRTMIGYDLKRKTWDHLNVDLIQETSWSENTDIHLIADADIKELAQALITIKIAAEHRTSGMIQMKENRVMMLLHGGPQPGKIFTAESIAELAEKCFLPVECSKIGTKPKYLQSMFYIARLWGAVILLDAEGFPEQCSMEDMTRNSLASDLIHEVEGFGGIIILTSKSAGNLDELLKSRSRLSLHYESLTQPRRAQIWRNFLGHLNSLGEKNIDFGDIDTHMSELSEREMNEQQICNAITTAKQLAQFQGKAMTIDHLRYVNSIADKSIPLSGESESRITRSQAMKIFAQRDRPFM